MKTIFDRASANDLAGLQIDIFTKLRDGSLKLEHLKNFVTTSSADRCYMLGEINNIPISGTLHITSGIDVIEKFVKYEENFAVSYGGIVCNDSFSQYFNYAPYIIKNGKTRAKYCNDHFISPNSLHTGFVTFCSNSLTKFEVVSCILDKLHAKNKQNIKGILTILDYVLFSEDYKKFRECGSTNLGLVKLNLDSDSINPKWYEIVVHHRNKQSVFLYEALTQLNDLKNIIVDTRDKYFYTL